MKSVVTRLKKKMLSAMVAVSVTASLSVSAFASGTPPFVGADGVIDPTVFDPLSTSITANVGAVMPKVIVVVGLLIAIGIVFAFFRKHAKA